MNLCWTWININTEYIQMYMNRQMMNMNKQMLNVNKQILNVYE